MFTVRPPTKNSSGARPESLTERITDSARIAALLNNLVKGRHLLAVTVEGGLEPCTSTLVAIDPARLHVMLDELIPPRPKKARLEQGQWLHMSGRIKGLEIRFAGQVEAIIETDGALAYCLTFPVFVDYDQRREHYRARLRAARRITISLSAEQDRQIRGELRDISVGGVGATFRGSLPARVQAGARLKGCHIHLPGESLVCEIEICFLSRSLHDRSFAIGARFVALEPAKRRRIAQFVAEIDRQSIRRNPQRR